MQCYCTGTVRVVFDRWVGAKRVTFVSGHARGATGPNTDKNRVCQTSPVRWSTVRPIRQCGAPDQRHLPPGPGLKPCDRSLHACMCFLPASVDIRMRLRRSARQLLTGLCGGTEYWRLWRPSNTLQQCGRTAGATSSRTTPSWSHLHLRRVYDESHRVLVVIFGASSAQSRLLMALWTPCGTCSTAALLEQVVEHV